MASDYSYGRRKELQVAEFLERRGFAWGRTPGSRGFFDLIARRGRLSLTIQVKSTRGLSISYTRLTIREETSLLQYCEGSRVTPAVALVSRNYVWLVRIPDGEEIFKGTLKSLKYEYPYEN